MSNYIDVNSEAGQRFIREMERQAKLKKPLTWHDSQLALAKERWIGQIVDVGLSGTPTNKKPSLMAVRKGKMK